MRKYIDKLEDLPISEIFSSKILGIDTETKGFDPYLNELLLVQIATPENCYVIDARFVDLSKIVYLFNDYDGIYLFFNGKFDIKFLNYNYKFYPKNIFDCMIAEILLTVGLNTKLMPSLNDLNFKYFDKLLDKDIRDTFKDQIAYFTDEQIGYAAEDAEVLLKLYPILKEQLEKLDLVRVNDLENKLCPVVAEMELTGFNFDVEAWKKLEAQARIGLDESDKALREMLSNLGTLKLERKVKKQPVIVEIEAKDINLNSPSQVLAALKASGLKVESTGFPELSLIDEPIINQLLRHRAFEKKVTTYGLTFITDNVHPKTKRIHSNFNQLGAASGRFSSNGPNMENIPNPDKDRYTDLNYREPFIATKGYTVFAADYGQIELRIAAEISQEPTLLKAFREGLDVHAQTATKMVKCLIEEVTKDQRSTAKNINFSILYGAGALNISQKQKVSFEVATEILHSYNEANSVLIAWLKKEAFNTVKKGYASTLLGRRRNFKMPDYNDPEEFKKRIAGIRREGPNTCVDLETQCLTKSGWKFSNEVSIGDEILTKNVVTGNLEWNKIDYLTFAELPTLEFKHRGMSAITSLDHRWLVDTKDGRKSIFRTTKNISRNGDDRIHRTGDWNKPDNKIWSDNELKILGLVLTDGHYKGNNSLVISQMKPKNIPIIDDLLENIDHHKRIEKYGYHRWDFHVSEFTKHVRSLFPNKTLTLEFIFSLSKRQAKILHEYMMFGDGSKSKYMDTFCAGEKERAEMFQVLTYIIGNASTISYVKPKISHPTKAIMNSPKSNGCYVVTILRRTRTQIIDSQIKDSGVRKVWCPTVKNSTFVAKRLGHIYVTGNCIQGTCADVIKVAMILLHDRLKNIGGRLLNTVHDEIVGEFPEEHIEEAKQIIDKCMLEAGQKFIKTIPVVYDCHYEKYWSK